MSLVETKPFPVFSYSPSEAKDAVRERRRVKLAASEVNLRGRRGSELERILYRVEFVAGRMEYLHPGWLERKVNLLSSYFSRIQEPDWSLVDEESGSNSRDWRAVVREAYWEGLETTVTQEYRFSKKGSSGNGQFDDYGYIQDLVFSYTFDFWRSLRVCQRLDISPTVGVRIAKLSYHFNPDKLIVLSDRYKDLNLGVITSALFGYPKTTEAFLDNFIAEKERLSADPRYKDLNPSVIERALLGYPKTTEAFLDNFIKSEFAESKEIEDIENIEAIDESEFVEGHEGVV